MAQGNGGIIGQLNTPTQNAATGVWTMRDMELAQQANKWPATAYQYQITRSLRFNSADSAYLNRTPASAGSRNIWTCSFWIKPSLQNIANIPTIIGVDTSGTDGIQFDTSYRLAVVAGGSDKLITSQVFRDPSAWYHVVVAADVTQGTATNRLKIYVNGSEVTAFASDNRSTLASNSFKINTAIVHHVGNNPAVNRYYDGYLAELYMIDGQQLTPTAFGEFNADTGVWQPKAYAGTYGTNGFWLKFADNSGTTATTLGKDSSPNGNNWTPNNFSVAAGAGNDSLIDTPTAYGVDSGAGGEVRGNYCTLNPLTFTGGSTSANGNLDGTVASGDSSWLLGSIAVSSGKWYWEWTPTANLIYNMVGITRADASNKSWVTANSFAYWQNGNKYNNNSNSAYGATYVLNDVIGIALDMDAGTVTFYKNGVSQGIAYTGLTGAYMPFFGCAGTGSTGSFTANFGQRPWAYTAPSGFKALCTQNLPTPAVGATANNRGGNHFNAITFTGNGVSPRAMTGFGFSPDLIWSARRDVSYGIQIFDSVRGAGIRLNTGYASIATAAESTGYGLVNSFDSDGYTSTAVDQASNISGGSYVTWAWNAGESTVSNTAGSITSSVRANPTAGISVVTFTSSASGAFTVGHGLGAAPAFVITKLRGATNNWNSYHAALGNTVSINLNQSDAAFTGSTNWNSTSPTSTVISFGSNWAGSYSVIAYCFAEVQGFSKFGSYVGNGSADGTFVYCGFRPRWIMVKDSVNASWPWWIVDTVRGTVNPLAYYMTTNTEAAETNNFSGYVICDAVSNGFKIRSSDAYGNTNGDTYIFAAFAEFPFKYGLAR